MTEKLKPCPVCGSKAEIQRCWNKAEYYAHCTKPDCEECYLVDWSVPTKKEAIEIWNRRCSNE